MAEYFRVGPDHAKDMAKVIAYLSRRTGRKPFIAGTCRSTYSVSSIANRIDNTTISGVILTSTRTKGRKSYGPISEEIGKGRVQSPMLFVHHEDDDCKGSPYDRITSVLDFFRETASGVNLLTVKGGWENSGRTQRRGCGDNGSHKFYGTQAAVVETMLSWMAGKQIWETIEGGQ
jgi:hypothetical protein